MKEYIFHLLKRLITRKKRNPNLSLPHHFHERGKRFLKNGCNDGDGKFLLEMGGKPGMGALVF